MTETPSSLLSAVGLTLQVFRKRIAMAPRAHQDTEMDGMPIGGTLDYPGKRPAPFRPVAW